MGSPNGGSSGFQFITSINTISRNDETRRKVRSHARRQRLPSETEHPPDDKLPPTKPATQKERLSKFRLGGTAASNAKSKQVTAKARKQIKQEAAVADIKTHMLTSDLGFTVGKELPNFPLLKIETTPMTETLLKYCMTVCLSPQEKFVQKWFQRNGAPSYMTKYHSSFLALSFAMNPDGDWLSSIHIDAAATHSFMALIAAMHNSLADFHDTSTIDFHRFQALKSINERLNEEGKDISTPVSDGVIVACSLLVNIESFIGSSAAAAAHMNGLHRMVELRGGLVNGFWYSTLLQRAIAWADFSYATTANQLPKLEFVPNMSDVLETGDLFTTRSKLANVESVSPLDMTILNVEAVELLELLRTISDRISTFDYTHMDKLMNERTQVSDSIYVVEWRLLQAEDRARKGQFAKAAASPDDEVEAFPNLTSPGSASYSHHCPDLSSVLLYASHLFLHLAIRGQPPTAQRHRALLESLTASLCEALPALQHAGLYQSSTTATSSSPASSSSPHDASSWSHGSPHSHTTFESVCSNGSGEVKSESSSEDWPHASVALDYSATSPSFQLRARSPKDDIHGSILLWALFVGACVRLPSVLLYDELLWQGQPRLSGPVLHGFYVRALRAYCRAKHVMDREALASRLREVVWLGSWAENQLELVWEEIGGALNNGQKPSG